MCLTKTNLKGRTSGIWMRPGSQLSKNQKMLLTDRPPPPVLPEQAGTSAPLEVSPVHAGTSASSAVPPVQAGSSASTTGPPVHAGTSASTTVPPVQSEFSPETVRPHPRAGPRKITKANGREKCKSAILTDTPEKEALERKKAKFKRKPTKVKRKLTKNTLETSQQTKTEKKKHTEKDSDSEIFALSVWRATPDRARCGFNVGSARHGLMKPALMVVPFTFATIVSQMGNCEYLML